MQEIRAFYTGELWDHALYRYQGLRDLLTQIKVQHSDLADRHQSELDVFIKKLQRNEMALRKAVGLSTEPPKPERHIATLQNKQPLLVELSGDLQNSFWW